MERPEKKIRVKRSWKNLLLDHWPLVVFLLVFVSMTAYKLISAARPFYDWDESLYVQVGREMVQNKFFLAPVWQGKIWFDKPPLSSLFFGLVTYAAPVAPEVSARLFVLFVVSVILVLTYVLYFKVTKNTFVATLALMATAFSPIFLQRTQVVSLDIFLLLGWLGYFVYLDHPIFGLGFLFLSVQSKSLLGFYPLGIYGVFLLFQVFTRRIPVPQALKKIRIMLLQSAALSAWYIIMLLLYGQAFWQAHIIESHFRRVTASIESHFGQRTFYIDLLREQLGWYLIPSIVGFLFLTTQWLRKKLSDAAFLMATAFVPWFIFLNVTKTKIAWYLYPAIPQFFFFAVYPLTFLKKPAKLLPFVAICLAAIIMYTAVVKNSFFTAYYSGFDSHILLSQTARKQCRSLAVLVSPSTRDTYKTLTGLSLTIATTDWWGDHPSMVYYFQKPLYFFYDTTLFTHKLSQYQCSSIYSDDVQLMNKTGYREIASYSGMLLYKHD